MLDKRRVGVYRPLQSGTCLPERPESGEVTRMKMGREIEWDIQNALDDGRLTTTEKLLLLILAELRRSNMDKPELPREMPQPRPR